MRRQVRKALEKEFVRLFRGRLPQFRTIKVERAGRILVFEWHFRDDLAFYLWPWISTRNDSFTIEGGWSRKGQFPAGCPLLFPRDIPLSGIKRDKPRDREFVFRLGHLSEDLKDKWRHLGRERTLEDILRLQQKLINEGVSEDFPPLSEALVAVPGVAQQVMSDIERLAIPYFAEIIEHVEKSDSE